MRRPGGKKERPGYESDDENGRQGCQQLSKRRLHEED
jgi:hypothetical protein